MGNALGTALRDARRAAGLTQVQVAEACGLPQSHLSRIERGRLDMRTSALEKVAEAIGATVVVTHARAPIADPYEDEMANRQYLLGLLVAKRITADSLRDFRAWLVHMQTKQGDFPYYQQWLAICDRGPSAVAAAFSDPTEYGRYLRSVATIRPFVSQHERDLYFRPQVSADLLSAAGITR